jgi:hypothetical protein
MMLLRIRRGAPGIVVDGYAGDGEGGQALPILLIHAGAAPLDEVAHRVRQGELDGQR